MLRNHVRRLEQRTLDSLLSTLTKCAETHIRRLRINRPNRFKSTQKKIICPKKKGFGLLERAAKP